MPNDELIPLIGFWIGLVGLIAVLVKRPYTAKTLVLLLPFAAMVALFFHGRFATIQ
jgi:hypothetical protein